MSDANFWDGSVKEFGGYEGAGKFLDEKIPAGHKPTATGEIARTDNNPNYGKFGPESRTYPASKGGGPKPHFGVDYSGKVGDDVYAMYDGTVTQIGKSGVYGENFVRTSSVINGKTYNVDYGHMSKHFALNKNITAGKLIGYMGRMGNNFPSSMPTHVHISVWRSVKGLQGFVMPWWK